MSECQKVRDEGICSWYAMRMTIIAIANQKGGTAKTTSTAAIGVHLGRLGVPTHLIDMDPQADLSAAFGITDDSNGLLSSLECADALPIVRVSENLTLSPSSLQLLRCETEFLSRPSREFVLRSAIERTELPNDAIVLVDCPPSLGVLSIASLGCGPRTVCGRATWRIRTSDLATFGNDRGFVAEIREPRTDELGRDRHQCPSPAIDHSTGRR